MKRVPHLRYCFFFNFIFLTFVDYLYHDNLICLLALTHRRFHGVVIIFFFYKFSPNSLIGRIGKDTALAKQSLLRWPCPLPSDRAIPGLWQNLESKV